MTTSFASTSMRQVWLLAAVLFISYLCIGISLPVIPLYVTTRLGLSNVWAGLGVGIPFLATVLTRGFAGRVSDRHGPKVSVVAGLALYTLGAITALVAGLLSDATWIAYGILIAGRLLLGLGESLVAVGIISWGIGVVGPERSGRVLAIVGASIYGALAAGGPVGVAMLGATGLSGAMALGAALPLAGLLMIWAIPRLPPQPDRARPSIWTVVGQVWWYGAIVCLQGIGFAAIGAFLSLHFRAEHWSYAGLGLTAFGVGFVLVRLAFGGLPDRLGGMPVAIGSLVVEAAGQLMIWSATGPELSLAGAFLTGLGCSMIFPAMGREVVQRVQPHLRGTALGAFSAFQDVAYGLTGPIAGLLADRAGYGSVYLIGGIAAGIGVLIATALRARPAALA